MTYFKLATQVIYIYINNVSNDCSNVSNIALQGFFCVYFSSFFYSIPSDNILIQISGGLVTVI